MHLSGTKSFAVVLVLFAGFGLANIAKATTITVGNPVPGGSVIDTCMGCDYIVGQPFDAAATVLSYTFTSYGAGDITPLLFTRTNSGGNATFTLVGIGTAQTITSAGVKTFSFGLTSGTSLTTYNTYFGFFSNTPVDLFTYTTANGGAFFANPGLALNGTTTSSYSSGFHQDQLGYLNNRDYSIEATAVTPEPATFSLLALGLSSLGAMARFRRR